MLLVAGVLLIPQSEIRFMDLLQVVEADEEVEEEADEVNVGTYDVLGFDVAVETGSGFHRVSGKGSTCFDSIDNPTVVSPAPTIITNRSLDFRKAASILTGMPCLAVDVADFDARGRHAEYILSHTTTQKRALQEYSMHQ